MPEDERWDVEPDPDPEGFFAAIGRDRHGSPSYDSADLLEMVEQIMREDRGLLARLAASGDPDGRFVIKVVREDGDFVATCLNNHVSSFGDSAGMAVEMIIEALQLWISETATGTSIVRLILVGDIEIDTTAGYSEGSGARLVAHMKERADGGLSIDERMELRGGENEDVAHSSSNIDARTTDRRSGIDAVMDKVMGDNAEAMQSLGDGASPTDESDLGQTPEQASAEKDRGRVADPERLIDRLASGDGMDLDSINDAWVGRRQADQTSKQARRLAASRFVDWLAADGMPDLAEDVYGRHRRERAAAAAEVLANAVEDLLFTVEAGGMNHHEILRQAWQHYVNATAER